jgi:voltage-gated potassium channel
MSRQQEVLVFGCGSLGEEVARQLRERGYRLLLVDDNEAALGAVRERGYATERLDYTDDEALRSIGIGAGVDAIFCMFAEDASNVFLTISARGLDPALKIVSIAESIDSRHKLLSAGASKVIDFYEISAARLYELIRRPLIVETLEHTVFSSRDLDLAEVSIRPGCGLIGQGLEQLTLEPDYNLVLLGLVERELGQRLIFAPQGAGLRLQAGDVLVVMGPLGEIERLRATLGEAGQSPSAKGTDR